MVKILVFYIKVLVILFDLGYRVDEGCVVFNGMSRKIFFERYSEFYFKYCNIVVDFL